MSFSCDHCGFENNEIQNPGKINDKGIKIKLTVSTNKDLNRQVVKSDYTSIKIPKLDFEIPSQSQKGGEYFIFIFIISSMAYIQYMFMCNCHLQR